MGTGKIAAQVAHAAVGKVYFFLYLYILKRLLIFIKLFSKKVKKLN